MVLKLSLWALAVIACVIGGAAWAHFIWHKPWSDAVPEQMFSAVCGLLALAVWLALRKREA